MRKPHNRTIWIFAIAALLCVGAFTFNAAFPDYSKRRAFETKRYWLHKVHSHEAHSMDIVLAGDSRVYRGLAPELFRQALPGARVLNFGFSSGGLNPVMFGAIDDLMTQDATRPRAVVIGVTPVTLTAKAARNEQYLQYLRDHPPAAYPIFDEIAWATRALSFKRIGMILRKREKLNKELNFIEVFHDDGWVESDWRKRDPRSALKSYGTVFEGDQVTPEAIAVLLNKVRDWRAGGVAVIGFYPPVTPEMLALEDAKSGFDRAAFIPVFEQAGGIWVDPGTGYDSFDGSHLTPEAARRLSAVLAQAVKEAVEQPQKP